MLTEKTLLSIISDLTTDKILQDKVIALYQDHKSNLRHYAWYSEPSKEVRIINKMYFNYLLLILFFVNPILVLASPPETASATDPAQGIRHLYPGESIEDYLSKPESAKYRSILEDSLMIDSILLYFSLDCYKSMGGVCEDLGSSLIEEREDIQEDIHSCLNKEGFKFLQPIPHYEIVLRRTEDGFIMIHPDDSKDGNIDRISEKCLISVFHKFINPYKNEITNSIRIPISLSIIAKIK